MVQKGLRSASVAASGLLKEEEAEEKKSDCAILRLGEHERARSMEDVVDEKFRRDGNKGRKAGRGVGCAACLLERLRDLLLKVPESY